MTHLLTDFLLRAYLKYVIVSIVALTILIFHQSYSLADFAASDCIEIMYKKEAGGEEKKNSFRQKLLVITKKVVIPAAMLVAGYGVYSWYYSSGPISLFSNKVPAPIPILTLYNREKIVSYDHAQHATAIHAIALQGAHMLIGGFNNKVIKADRVMYNLNSYPKSKSYIIKDEQDMPVGFIEYKMSQKGGHIHMVATQQSVRGQGYGTQLLRYAIDDILSAGGQKITIYVQKVNEEAIRIYTACIGFDLDDKSNAFNHGESMKGTLNLVRYKQLCEAKRSDMLKIIACAQLAPQKE